MQYKQKVKTIYEEIKPALELFDWRRKEALAKTTNLSLILLVICLVVVGLVSFMPIALPVKILISGLVAGISLGISTTFRRKYIKKFKKDLSELLFDREGIQVTHESYNHIYSGHFKQSGLFEDGNNFVGEDLITGVKGDLYFIGSELRAAYVRKRKNLPDVIRLIFDGLYLCSELPIDIGTTVTIYDRDFKYENGQSISTGDFDTLSKNFDRYFEVEYTDYDQTSDFLTPEFMRALVQFREEQKHPFILKVSRNQVYLAIQEDKDFFNINLKKAAHDQAGFEHFAEDCQFFFDVVKVLEKVK